MQSKIAPVVIITSTGNDFFAVWADNSCLCRFPELLLAVFERLARTEALDEFLGNIHDEIIYKGFNLKTLLSEAQQRDQFIHVFLSF